MSISDVRSVEHGVVSVVIAVDTDTDAARRAVERLTRLDWPAELLEPVLVADAQHATALEATISPLHPKASLTTVPTGASLADARNAGAEVARGEFLAFVDRDAVPDATWLRSAVDALRGDSNAAAIASKVIDPHGAIAYVDAGLSLAGEAVHPYAGEPDSGEHSRANRVLFPSEWAVVMDTRAFRYAGGFDARCCAGIEHVDLGWRMNIAGLGVRVAPDSVVRLMTSPAPPRDAPVARLAMLVKNLEDANLGSALAGALLGLDPATAAATRNAFVAQLPVILAERRTVQMLRRVADVEVIPLLGQPDASHMLDEHGAALVREVTGAGRVTSTRHRVLVATPDVLQPKMAGPAIRAYEMARALAREHDVHLVSTLRCDLDDEELAARRVSDAGFKTEVDWADVVVVQGHLVDQHPWLRRSDKVLVVDIYDPFHLEVLEQSRDQSPFSRRHSVRIALETLNEQLARGDYFLCASVKQRDFWLGQLAAIGRINPATYDDDENLASLIGVVPFGISDQVPQQTMRVLRGVVPGIGEHDKIILWGGGVYNWFDPLTLLYALDKLRARLPDVRLYFMGMRHPNPNVPAMQMAFRAQRLADDLGLTGTHVFFNEGWVDYDERQNYLLEADIGVSTHLDHVETEFSFRTRVLDYLWASLPIVATEGDALADIIERRGLGLTAPAGDVDALEEALFVLLSDEERRAAAKAAIRATATDFLWSRSVEPLVRFCRDPRRARDLVDPRQRVMLGDPLAQAMWGRTGWRHALAVAMGHARRGEWGDLGRKVRMRLRTYIDPNSAGPGARQI
jgi:glycosyltransferase involved in cell wall biosynthesis